MRQQTERVIAEMMGYFQEFVEVPHPVFGNLPVCPFARKARLDNAIMFRVYPFADRDVTSDAGFMEIVTTFAGDDAHEILIVAHPDAEKLSVADMTLFVDALNPKLAPHDLVGFGGHPQDPFNIQGVYTRRSPYPHLSIQSTPYLKQITQSLRNTDYYRNWTHADLEAIGFHHRQ